jgi:nucleoside-diphosphate-sugar epimerase
MANAISGATPRVLVTGAGGFIGAALLPLLAENFGGVSAGLRHARPLPTPGVKPVACDLDDPAQIAEALKGVDLVIHAAYGDERVMPKQAENLLDAMSVAGTRGLVALSSIAVYGGREGRVTEADPPEPLGVYAVAKARCETLYRAWSAEAAERRVIALRPGIVYGTGSRFWIDKMAARIASGGWGVFGSRGDGRAALVHIDDLARQVLAASRLLRGADRDALPGFAALNAVGPETPSWNDYFQALAGVMGQPPLRCWSPAEILLRQGAAIPAKLARRLSLPLCEAASLAPTPGEMALFARRADYSGEAAARLLGFSPCIGLTEGLARCGLDKTAPPQASR